MDQKLLESVKRSVKLMDGSEPSWVSKKKEPQFIATTPGGVGPEMILLHGLFGALSNWDGVLPLFTKFCKPIALEFPILSGSRADVHVKALAAYTQYYVQRQKYEPVSLCGNSLGGHVALRLCLAAPELVDCLILSATSGLYERTAEAVPVRPNEAFIRDQMSKVFSNPKFITESAIREILDIVGNKLNVLNIIQAARSAKKDNLEKLLPQIKVPVLLLWGEEDYVTPMDVCEEFHRLIPHAEVATIKNCGHAPMIEHPEWFSEQVHNFLKKNSKRFAAAK